MGRPYALLRIGFSYDRTLGMRRLTNTPVDLAIGTDGILNILCRGQGGSFVRRLSLDDEDLGAFNLTGGGAQVGGSAAVNGNFLWPASMAIDGEGSLVVSDEGTHKISVIDKDRDIVAQWGEFGLVDGQLRRPSGIALDPDENVYVADAYNHRVQRFTKEGKFILSFGRHGLAKGEFNMPWGVAVDELGEVYVADWRNDRVQKFTPGGEFLLCLGESGAGDGQFNRPSGVEVDKDGDIYVADWGNHRVQLFSSEGRFVEKFIGDATLSKQARNYMMTNLKAMRLREMTSLEPQKRLRWPVSVRADNQGRMYALDYGSHRVQVYQKEALPLEPHEIADVPRSPSLYTQF